MVLYIIDHPYHYEAENLCRVFYPFDKVTVQHEFMPSDENRTVYTAEENGEYIVRIEDADGKTERKAKVGAETEYGMVSLLFDAFCAHTGKMPRWGMLTGIHPIKLLRQLTEQHGEAEAARLFREKYFVSNEKTALAVRTLRAQKPITDKVRENDYSLYISVPFCPTRCAYCSFAERGKGQETDSGISPPAFGRAERDGESRRCFGLKPARCVCRGRHTHDVLRRAAFRDDPRCERVVRHVAVRGTYGGGRPPGYH